jgi:hypothetical protein
MPVQAVATSDLAAHEVPYWTPRSRDWSLRVRFGFHVVLLRPEVVAIQHRKSVRMILAEHPDLIKEQFFVGGDSSRRIAGFPRWLAMLARVFSVSG